MDWRFLTSPYWLFFRYSSPAYLSSKDALLHVLSAMSTTNEVVGNFEKTQVSILHNKKFLSKNSLISDCMSIHFLEK